MSKKSLNSKNKIQKSVNKNYKNWSQHYYSTHSNQQLYTYPHKWKDNSEKIENLDLGFSEWEFKIIKNQWHLKIDGVRCFSEIGISILLSVKIDLNSMSNFFHAILAKNTLPPEEDTQTSMEENDIQINFTIKSADEDYKKWFKNWSINEEGMSLSFNSQVHMEIIDSISSINQIIEKMKARLMLEKLSQPK